MSDELKTMEQIVPMSIGTLVPQRFLDYAMYVIKDRALPDVKDGLKPVHRRIIYAMGELGILSNKPYKKCARTVGDVLGKYHPHGDTSVYEALVILAQEFSTRYPIIDGHGNFGSIDGDPAAAMRYTESRLSRYGQELLTSINKNTVDFKPNYDQEEVEPVVLPSLLPNLLINGSMGIAVGMATKIPSHNIRDVYKACYKIIDDLMEGKETTIDEVIDLIHAPDFATGGTIMGLSGVREGYKTGKGKVAIRSKYVIEESKKGTSIVITEIPYKVNKQKLIESIRELMKDIKNSKGTVIKASIFPQIKEIRDESDKDGMRIVIDLKKDENPQIVINNLIANTKFQDNFSMNLTCLSNGQPKVMNILEMLNEFLAHAAEVITRRTQFDLDKASKRLNIVEGILLCFMEDPDNPGVEIIDRVTHIIRQADDPVSSLVELGFNQAQAEYICEMKLRSLSKASQAKLEQEKESLNASIGEFNAILSDDKTLLSKIKAEFVELETKFGDDRRTDVEIDCTTIEEEDLIKNETLIITYTTEGTIKAVEEKEYKSQRRGGKGVRGTNTKEDEIIKFMFTTSSKDDLLFFTTEGRCHVLKAYRIGKSTKAAKGRNINNYLNLNVGEKIVSVLNTNIKDKENNLLMITRLGQVKKLSLQQLSSKFNVTRVITFKEGDSLIQALLNKEGDNVLIVTKKGMSLRIDTNAEGNKAIRPMGRTAAGVAGINVQDGDEVVDMCTITDEDLILTVTEDGLGKKTKASEWNIIGRGGKGVVAHDTGKAGEIISVLTAHDDDEVFIATEQGLITRIPTVDIRTCGRNSKGVKVINLNDNDKVTAVSLNKNKEDTEEGAVEE